VLYVWESGRTAQAVVTASDTGLDPASTRRETAMQPGTLTRPELTASDRCDRCGAAAKVRAVMPKGGELLFCGHHARAHADKLRELDIDVQSGS
jgi:hypothetical protein